MTARPDDATPEASAQKQTAARPDRGQAESGKGRGAMHKGRPGDTQVGGAGFGSDPASERSAPGMGTDKKDNDVK